MIYNFTRIYLHVISKNPSMVVLVYIVQKLYSHSLVFKQPTVNGCRNLQMERSDTYKIF